LAGWEGTIKCRESRSQEMSYGLQGRLGRLYQQNMKGGRGMRGVHKKGRREKGQRKKKQKAGKLPFHDLAGDVTNRENIGPKNPKKGRPV